MDRLRAWARANGEEIVYQTGDYVVNQNNARNLVASKDNSNPYIVIIIAVTTSSVLCLGLIIIKKRKHI